ncbi:helix-turn-helix domain-containing protein [Amycolatopsis echigonensis]|uniref:Helix-turn-helix domain-containing protein n=1 Tax=Amycolatopsis echigonensis TaxID=2576905 RepID=A0A8E1VUC6_9PSEU|nr:helix-turn-helix domain-containing protein [Amycolatopsis echigonensis]
MSSQHADGIRESPLTALQSRLRHPRVIGRFDRALEAWSRSDLALVETSSRDRLARVLATREYETHDRILHALLERAAVPGRDGATAAEIVLSAMLPAVPGVTGRVIRAVRASTGGGGPRRGVTGGGASADEANADVQATVIGHLWEQVRCFPLRRRHHVAANLVRETQRAALRSFGVDHVQAAVEVASVDDDAFRGALAQPEREVAASEELLSVLSWAVARGLLDERGQAVLTRRFFGDRAGRDGVATDRQVGEELGVSQPTVTRWRNRAIAALADAAEEYPGGVLPWAS